MTLMGIHAPVSFTPHDCDGRRGYAGCCFSGEFKQLARGHPATQAAVGLTTPAFSLLTAGQGRREAHRGRFNQPAEAVHLGAYSCFPSMLRSRPPSPQEHHQPQGLEERALVFNQKSHDAILMRCSFAKPSSK